MCVSVLKLCGLGFMEDAKFRCANREKMCVVIVKAEIFVCRLKLCVRVCVVL